jgi:hypothetical protein
MATFPALIPSSRTFTPGSYAFTSWRSRGGRSSQSQHSNALVDQRLRLGFLAIGQADLVQLQLHWAQVRGRFGLFDLPEAVWGGTAGGAVFTPERYAWRYVAQPAVEDVSCGWFDVTVELEMLPRSGGDLIRTTFGDALVTQSGASLVTR